MAVNPSLQLIVVDPDAVQVIKRSDELLPSDPQFASVADRVLPLPYKACDALHGRRLLEIVRNLIELVAISGQYQLDVLGGIAGSVEWGGLRLPSSRSCATLARLRVPLRRFALPRAQTIARTLAQAQDACWPRVGHPVREHLSSRREEANAAFDVRVQTYCARWITSSGAIPWWLQCRLKVPAERGCKTEQALIAFFRTHRDRIDQFATEFEIWARLLPWTVLSEDVCRGLRDLPDDLRMCAATFDDVVQSNRYAPFAPGSTKFVQSPGVITLSCCRHSVSAYGNQLPLCCMVGLRQRKYPDMHDQSSKPRGSMIRTRLCYLGVDLSLLPSDTATSGFRPTPRTLAVPSATRWSGPGSSSAESPAATRPHAPALPSPPEAPLPFREGAGG